MALEIVFARDCAETTCDGAMVLFFVFFMCFQMALQVFLVSASVLTHRTTVGVHLGWVVDLFVVPEAMSVERRAYGLFGTL